MRVYCTSKNTGPSYHSDPIHMVYLGTSVDKAIRAVGKFSKYEKNQSQYPREFMKSFTALPLAVDSVLIKYYMADGWWYSIVVFDLEPEVKYKTPEERSKELKDFCNYLETLN